MTQNLVVATAYATLETNAVIQAESEEEVSALVCNRKAAEGTFLALFKGLIKIVDRRPSVEAILYLNYLCTRGA